MAELVPISQIPIEELEMGVRPYNILKRMGIHTLGDLHHVTSDEVARWSAKTSTPLGDHDYANIHQQVERAESIFRGGSW